MSLKDSFMSAWEALSVSIENGASMTDGINLGGLRLFGLVIPDEWTAANLTFQASFDAGATWVNILNKAGNENIVTVSVGGYLIIDSTDFAALQYLKIRSGTAAAPVAQEAARNISLVLRRI